MIRSDIVTTTGSYLGVSKNNGTPKSSILIGFSIVNHPFWGTTIFGNIHLAVFFRHLFGVWPANAPAPQASTCCERM